MRQNFFTVQVANQWNKLPSEVIESAILHSFERRLDKTWKEYKSKFDCGMYIPLSDDKHQMVRDSLKECTGKCGCNSNPVATLPHATVVFRMQPFNFKSDCSPVTNKHPKLNTDDTYLDCRRSGFPGDLRYLALGLYIGGSRGAPPARAPPLPTGSNSFVFAYVFAEKHPHWRLAPPNGKSWIRHCYRCEMA